FTYASIMLLLVLFASCRSTRLLEADQALVTKVEIDGIDPQFAEGASAYIPPALRPNSRINLFIYNLANARKGRYRTTNIRNVGEPPHILDSALVDFSTQQIARYLQSKGYFNATVDQAIVRHGKRAHLYFHVVPGEPFTLRNVDVDIADTALTRLYAERLSATSTIKPGSRYDADSLVAERERVYQLMRQRGYVACLRQYMRVGVDSSVQRNQADVNLIVDDPEGLSGHTKFDIDSGFVVIRHDRMELNRATPEEVVLDGQLAFRDYTGRFKAAPI